MARKWTEELVLDDGSALRFRLEPGGWLVSSERWIMYGRGATRRAALENMRAAILRHVEVLDGALEEVPDLEPDEGAGL